MYGYIGMQNQPDKKLPARPFIAIDKKTEGRILNFIKSQI